MALVAKSYQDLEIVRDTYIENGKRYCDVRTKDGKVKRVKSYTTAEYARYYPDVKIIHPGNRKHILGFDNGYITIFKGNTYANLEWFERSIARYHSLWGWYIVSTDTIPEDIPEGITPVQLPWGDVGNDDGTLKDTAVIKKVIEDKIYEEGPSQWQGAVGDKLERTLTVIKNIEKENYYGMNHIMTFIDVYDNLYCWSTSAQNWPVGTEVRIKGTVKELGTYQKQKITYLTICTKVG